MVSFTVSDDPSQVDTVTLITSLRSDIGRAQHHLQEGYALLAQATATAWELTRREQDREKSDEREER